MDLKCLATWVVKLAADLFDNWVVPLHDVGGGVVASIGEQRERKTK